MIQSVFVRQAKITWPAEHNTADTEGGNQFCKGRIAEYFYIPRRRSQIICVDPDQLRVLA